MRLKREAPTPLYLQLKNALVTDIDTGRYKPHEPLMGLVTPSINISHQRIFELEIERCGSFAFESHGLSWYNWYVPVIPNNNSKINDEIKRFYSYTGGKFLLTDSAHSFLNIHCKPLNELPNKFSGFEIYIAHQRSHIHPITQPCRFVHTMRFKIGGVRAATSQRSEVITFAAHNLRIEHTQ